MLEGSRFQPTFQQLQWRRKEGKTERRGGGGGDRFAALLWVRTLHAEPCSSGRGQQRWRGSPTAITHHCNYTARDAACAGREQHPPDWGGGVASP